MSSQKVNGCSVEHHRISWGHQDETWNAVVVNQDETWDTVDYCAGTMIKTWNTVAYSTVVATRQELLYLQKAKLGTS